jgi:hypothetical protein
MTQFVPHFPAGGESFSSKELNRRGDETRAWAAVVKIAKTHSGARYGGNIEVRARASPSGLPSQAKERLRLPRICLGPGLLQPAGRKILPSIQKTKLAAGPAAAMTDAFERAAVQKPLSFEGWARARVSRFARV